MKLFRQMGVRERRLGVGREGVKGEVLDGYRKC